MWALSRIEPTEVKKRATLSTFEMKLTSSVLVEGSFEHGRQIAVCSSDLGGVGSFRSATICVCLLHRHGESISINISIWDCLRSYGVSGQLLPSMIGRWVEERDWTVGSKSMIGPRGEA